MKYISLSLVLILLLTACEQKKPAVMVQQIAVPAGIGATSPFLTSDNRGFYLAWLENDDKGKSMFFSRYTGKQWSQKKKIATGRNFLINWADTPSLLVLPTGIMAARWLEPDPRSQHAYNLWTSLSRDYGESWSEPLTPHTDLSPVEHGFASLIEGLSQADFSTIWLDGRNFHSEDGNENPDASTMLMHSTFQGDKFLVEEVLDRRVCDCCNTTALKLDSGELFAAYRDRSEDEMRDISYVRTENGMWGKPAPLHNDGWKIKACPLNGPAAASSGSTVAVAWFTAAQDKPAVNIAVSADEGKTFGKPVRIDSGKPLGRVDLKKAPGGFVVSWVEQVAEKDAAVQIRKIAMNGELGEVKQIASISADRTSGRPQIATHGSETLVAWTDLTAKKFLVARVLP